MLKVASWTTFVMYWAVRLLAGGAWRGNQKRREQGKDRVVAPPDKAIAFRQW